MDNNNPPQNLIEAIKRIRVLEQQNQLNEQRSEQRYQRSEQRAQRSEQRAQRLEQELNRLRLAQVTVPSGRVQADTELSSLSSDGINFLATGTTFGFTTDGLPTDTTVGSADRWSTGNNHGGPFIPVEEVDEDVYLTALNRAAAAVATEDTLRGIEGANISSTGSNGTGTTVVSKEVSAPAEE